MAYHGRVVEAHKVFFDYLHCGLAHTEGSPECTKVTAMSKREIDAAVEMAKGLASLEGFELKKVGMVEHYLGSEDRAVKVALLRFERDDSKNNGFGGEHISFTLNIESPRLMGLTRMQRDLTGDRFVSHQEALNAAVKFMQRHASDLMPAGAEVPAINEAEPSARVAFNNEDAGDADTVGLAIGNIVLHWIGDHKEEIIADGTNIEVHGMKVKMYVPSTKLWAWAVIDQSGSVETFERDISWDFEIFRRDTQMWLHDKWLETHKPRLMSPGASCVEAENLVEANASVRPI